MDAVLFARVSSTDQTTVPVQLDHLRKKAMDMGDTIIAEKPEMRSVSDKDEYRTFEDFLRGVPALGEIMALAKERRFQRLWVYKWDRLVRDRRWGAELIYTLERSGIRIESVIEGDNELVRNILLDLADFDNKNRLVHIREGYEKNVRYRKTLAGRAMWCVKKHKISKRLSWRVDAVSLIQSVFTLFVKENRSANEVVNILHISPPKFYRIIRSTLSIGKYDYEGKRYTLDLEPIIDEETFQKANERIKSVKRV